MIIQHKYRLTYIAYSESSNLTTYLADLDTLWESWIAAGEADRPGIWNDILAKRRQIDGEIAALAADGDAVELPMSSLSIRLRHVDPSSMTAVVPGTDLAIDTLSVDSSAILRVDVETESGGWMLEWMNLDSIRSDEGADGISFTLAGSRVVTAGAATGEIGPTIYRGTLATGRRTVRAVRPVAGIGPRTTITENGETWEVGEMAISADPVSSAVQYSEYEPVSGTAEYTDSDGGAVDSSCFEVVETLPASLQRAWSTGCNWGSGTGSGSGGFTAWTRYYQAFGVELTAPGTLSAALTADDVAGDYPLGSVGMKLRTGWTPGEGTVQAEHRDAISEALDAGKYHVEVWRLDDPLAVFTLVLSVA